MQVYRFSRRSALLLLTFFIPNQSLLSLQGLKSIESSLKTKDYHRLRLGIGAASGALSDHVLGHWSRAEESELSSFVMDAADAVERWVREDDHQAVMNVVNSQSKQ
jgi:peptidyl-tRNA hydrolase